MGMEEGEVIKEMAAITVKSGSRPNHLWIHLQKRWPGRKCIATIDVINLYGLSSGMLNRLHKLSYEGGTARSTLFVSNMNDIRHIFREAKRGNIKNQIFFSPFSLQ